MKLYPDGTIELTVTEYRQLIKKRKYKVRQRSVSLDQIKLIKTMAEDGVKTKEIAQRLGLTIDKVIYWRKNTPKELVM